MSRGSRASLVCVLAAVGLGLTGCFGQQEYEEMRQGFLDAAVAEFEPSSLGDVVCDVDGGKAGIGVGFTRQLMYEDPQLIESIIERLDELGYSVTLNEDRAVAHKPDGIFVAVSVVRRDGLSPRGAPSYHADCAIPAGGGVSVGFEERDVGIGPSADSGR